RMYGKEFPVTYHMVGVKFGEEIAQQVAALSESKHDGKRLIRPEHTDYHEILEPEKTPELVEKKEADYVARLIDGGASVMVAKAADIEDNRDKIEHHSEKKRLRLLTTYRSRLDKFEEALKKMQSMPKKFGESPESLERSLKAIQEIRGNVHRALRGQKFEGSRFLRLVSSVFRPASGQPSRSRSGAPKGKA
ncbi:MAG: hypothetical protein ABIG96_06785, partial [Candidatus Micrarchaeota archaeon]